MRFFHIIATALVAVTSVHGSNVIDLTPDNFDEVVGSGKFAMVEVMGSEFFSMSTTDQVASSSRNG